jgi:hypothetical protein
MTADTGKPKPKEGPTAAKRRATRTARQATLLRENLRRRKGQKRARDDAAPKEPPS